MSIAAKNAIKQKSCAGYALIDLLIFIALFYIGVFVAWLLTNDLPKVLRSFACFFIGICTYLAIICPISRKLKRHPIWMPHCPCCGKFQNGFHILDQRGWPRITFRCPSCNGEFVIWHNGKVGDKETWDKPVLTLNWPYAFGRYKKMTRPEQPEQKRQ